MDDWSDVTGPDRCSCGKPSTPGSDECHCCQHGMLPDSTTAREAARVAHRTTAAFLRRRSYLTRDLAERRILEQDAEHFERMAKR